MNSGVLGQKMFKILTLIKHRRTKLTNKTQFNVLGLYRTFQEIAELNIIKL